MNKLLVSVAFACVVSAGFGDYVLMDCVKGQNVYNSNPSRVETDFVPLCTDRIEAAGSVFIGNHSPESAGDYASGTNHTLPTMGLAGAFSGIGTDSFRHQVTYQELSREGLSSLAETLFMKITGSEAKYSDLPSALRVG